MAPVQLEIALHKGIWIEGKVTDQETAEPVPGVWLYYLPFRDNTFAQATPEFDRNGNGPNTSHQDQYQTKADGTYRLVGLAVRRSSESSPIPKSRISWETARNDQGNEHKRLFRDLANPVNPSKLWPNSMKEINPAATTNTVHLDFELKPGRRFGYECLILRESRSQAWTWRGEPSEAAASGMSSRGRSST